MKGMRPNSKVRRIAWFEERRIEGQRNFAPSPSKGQFSAILWVRS
jgi:hypothetical protein